MRDAYHAVGAERDRDFEQREHRVVIHTIASDSYQPVDQCACAKAILSH